MNAIRQLELDQMKKDLPDFSIGDTVKVSYKIREGQKERVQIFQGTIISIKGGGIRRTLKVRRIVQGEGVERTFPLHSPKLAEIEVTRSGKVRRSKLYYLRQRVGKGTRVRQDFAKDSQRAQANQAAKKASEVSNTEATETQADE